MPFPVNFPSAATASQTMNETINDTKEVTVRDTDVLGGSKNTSLRKHRGNMLLRDLIFEKLDDYDQAATKQEKVEINRLIINTMRKRYGSRFLRQTANGSWVQIGEQGVRDKISHAFRFACNQRKKELAHHHQQQQQQQQAEADEPSVSVALVDETKVVEDSRFSKHLEAVHECQRRILYSMMSQRSCSDVGSDDSSF